MSNPSTARTTGVHHGIKAREQFIAAEVSELERRRARMAAPAATRSTAPQASQHRSGRP